MHLTGRHAFFAPVLSARLLLVDFAALREVAALDAQNSSPVVIFRGYKLLNENMEFEELQQQFG
jgi:hypothetical protein